LQVSDACLTQGTERDLPFLMRLTRGPSSEVSALATASRHSRVPVENLVHYQQEQCLLALREPLIACSRDHGTRHLIPPVPSSQEQKRPASRRVFAPSAQCILRGSLGLIAPIIIRSLPLQRRFLLCWCSLCLIKRLWLCSSCFLMCCCCTCHHAAIARGCKNQAIAASE
jgi:hypothetical protein